MPAATTKSTSRETLKARYLECLRARSSLTLREIIKELLELNVSRDLLLSWAVNAGHDEKYAGKLLCECLTALGIRQRRPGAGRRSGPDALFLFAFAHELFGKDHQKCLRAALRASRGVAAEEIEAKGTKIIQEPELYTDAVNQFSQKLAETAKFEMCVKHTASKNRLVENRRTSRKGTVR